MALCFIGSAREYKDGDAGQKPLGLAPREVRTPARGKARPPHPLARIADNQSSTARDAGDAAHTGARPAACGESRAPPRGARPPDGRSHLVSRPNQRTKRRSRGLRALTPPGWAPERGRQAAWLGRRPPSLHPGVVAWRGPRWAPRCPPPAPLQLPHAPCGDAAAAPSDTSGPTTSGDATGKLQCLPQFRGGAYTRTWALYGGSPALRLDAAT